MSLRKAMHNIDISLRLSAQRALLGHIPSCLRSASLEVQGSEIIWQCVFDKEALDKDFDLLSMAGTGIIADFDEKSTMHEVFDIIPFPNKIKNLKWLVYFRHEHNYYES
jgi:hypothetical protein